MGRLSATFCILCLFLLRQLYAQVPVINSFSPASGLAGTMVILNGNNFNTAANSNVVYFGATQATVISASANQLTVVSPSGASYQPISVLNLTNNLTGYSVTPFNTTFSGSHKIPPIEFNSAVQLQANILPVSSNVVDLDQDGKPDLVVACKNSNSISFYRNVSTKGNFSAGSFATKIDVDLNQLFPVAVAVEDLDGDGKPDVIISYDGYSGTGFEVLRNTSTSGNISFAAAVTFATNGSPTSIAIGDVDGDGKPDVLAITTISGISTLSVFRNSAVAGNINGSSFTNKVDLVSNSSANILAVGDMDADGKLDIVAVSSNNSTVSLMRNTSANGNISFAAGVDFATGNFPQGISIGDLNGDGKPDLAVTNYRDNSVSVYFNTTGSGVFTSASLAPKTDIATGERPTSIAIMDMDGDGKPDIMTSNIGASTISIIHNTTATGSTTASSDTRTDTNVQSNFSSFCLGDIDGDGKPEMFVTNDFVAVYYNNPQFSPVISSISPPSGAVGSTAIINGNNFNPDASRNVVFFGSARASVVSASATALTVTVPTGTSYQPISALNYANGLTGYAINPFITTFSSKHAVAAADFILKATISGTDPQAVFDVGDIDGDGKPDLAVACYNSNSFSIYRNISTTGGAAFAAPIKFTTGGEPNNIRIVDIDGDGKPDVIVTNYYSGTISIYINKSVSGSITTDSFAAPVEFGTTESPGVLSVADINGDGKPDLIVSFTYLQGSVCIFENRSTPGNVNFNSVTTLTPAGPPTSLSVTDMDGDGKPDIVVAYGTNVLSVFRNISNGSDISVAAFAARQDINLALNAKSIATTDMNGDGKPDIVLLGLIPAQSAVGTNTAIAMLNISSPGSVALKQQKFYALGQGSLISFADIDGDGKPDMVVHGGNDATVLRNTSGNNNIDFGDNTDITLKANLGPTLVADIDGDGRPDLVAWDQGSYTTTVWLNEPQPTLPVLPPAPVISSINPAAALYNTTVKINGQNFSANAASNKVVFGVTAGQVTNSSATQLTVKVPSGSTTSQVSVLNLSDNLAGTSVNSFIPTLKMPQKLGVGSYTKRAFLTGDETISTTVADMNGDGIPDLISLVYPVGGGTSFSVHTNTNPNIGLSYSYGTEFGNSDRIRSGLAVADVDGDGKPDVILNANGDGVTIYLNTSTTAGLSFAPAIKIPAGAAAIAIADVDGDGRPDIAATTDNGVFFLMNASTPGAVSFPVQTFIQTGSINAIQLRDLDGDGKPDLITSSVTIIGSSYSYIYLNQSIVGGVSFSAPFYLNIGATESVVSAIADMDGDGKLDMVDNDAKNLTAFRNTSSVGNLSFSPAQTFPIANVDGASIKNIAIGDIDGDGKPDVAADVSDGANINQIVILKNSSSAGSISVSPALTLSADPTPLKVSIADLNGDGKPEILFDKPSTINNNLTGLGVFSNGNLVIVTSADTAFYDPTLAKPKLVDTLVFAKTLLPFTLKQATIGISQNFRATEDSLIFKGIAANTGDITGSYDNKTGILTLTSATATTTLLQSALRSVFYQNNNSVRPDTNMRVLSFTYTDGTDTSNTALRYIKIGPGTYTGFPVPIITANGATAFIHGDSVLLSVTPATGYNYQWTVNGVNIPGAKSSVYTAKESGDYSVILSLNSATATAAPIKVTAAFVLPSDNFILTITGATCNGSNNGSVAIAAQQTLNYTATITGNGLNAAYPFTTSSTINNLAAGTYSVCITVAGEAGFQQCFNVVINQPADLSVYSVVNTYDKTVSLKLSGGAQYTISLNEHVYITADSSITLSLTEGNNSLSVTTDKLCQGKVEKLIKIAAGIAPYPVPFQATLNINVGQDYISKISVEIHDVPNGTVVFSKLYYNQSGVLQLDLNGLSNGTYILFLLMDETEKTFKIIKQ